MAVDDSSEGKKKSDALAAANQGKEPTGYGTPGGIPPELLQHFPHAAQEMISTMQGGMVQFSGGPVLRGPDRLLERVSETDAPAVIKQITEVATHGIDKQFESDRESRSIDDKKHSRIIKAGMSALVIVVLLCVFCIAQGKDQLADKLVVGILAFLGGYGAGKGSKD